MPRVNRSRRYIGQSTVDYGLGGALLKVGSNIAQGKGFGSGALQGVGKAAITPGSGIGAGAELAGNLLQKTNNPLAQKIGQGLDVASNFAPGGGGLKGAIGDVAGLAANAGIIGGGAANAIGGLANLAGGGGGGGGGLGPMGALKQFSDAGLIGQGGGAGGNLLNLASNFLGEAGMSVPNKITNQNNMKFSYGAGGYNSPRFSAQAGQATPEQLAEASQILANMGKEEKMAKYGMMSDDAILQEIAKGLGGGEAPTPYQPEAAIADGGSAADYMGSAQHEANVTGKAATDSRGRTLAEPEAHTFMRDPETGEMMHPREIDEREAQRAAKGGRSVFGALADEAGQIGAGLAAASRGLDRRSDAAIEGRYSHTGGVAPGPGRVVDDFVRAYDRQQAEDDARRASGALGTVDQYNPFSLASDLAGQKSMIEERGQSLEEGGPHRSGGERMYKMTLPVYERDMAERDRAQFGGTAGQGVYSKYPGNSQRRGGLVKLLKRGGRR